MHMLTQSTIGVYLCIYRWFPSMFTHQARVFSKSFLKVVFLDLGFSGMLQLGPEVGRPTQPIGRPTSSLTYQPCALFLVRFATYLTYFSSA